MNHRFEITLLTSAEVAQLLSIRQNTLEIWRTKGMGPAYRKVGRAVRYVEADVLEWLTLQTRCSTQEGRDGNHVKSARA